MTRSRSDQPGLIGATRDLTGPKGIHKNLTKGKLGAGDIAVINQPDINRSMAQRFIDSQVGAVVNVAPFTTGRVPNFGPQMMLDSGIVLVENADEEITRKVKNGKKARLDEGKVFYGDRSIGGGATLDLDTAMERFDEARDTLGDHMEALSGNTAEFVRSESPLLIDGLGIPDVDIDMDDRKVLVVSPDPQLHEKLKDLRYFIREYDPIVIGVGAAADELIAAGHKPRIIVGDPETIATNTLRSGALVVLPAGPDGHAAGLERIQDLGVGAMTFPAATTNPTHLALLLAEYHGASMVVHLGENLNLDTLFTQAQDPETPSAMLTHLKVGSRLVDSTAVAELYRVSKSGSGWLWAILGVLLAIAVIIAIAGFSGDQGFVDNLIDTWNGIALNIQDLFRK